MLSLSFLFFNRKPRKAEKRVGVRHGSTGYGYGIPIDKHIPIVRSLYGPENDDDDFYCVRLVQLSVGSILCCSHHDHILDTFCVCVLSYRPFVEQRIRQSILFHRLDIHNWTLEASGASGASMHNTPMSSWSGEPFHLIDILFWVIVHVRYPNKGNLASGLGCRKQKCLSNDMFTFPSSPSNLGIISKIRGREIRER